MMSQNSWQRPPLQMGVPEENRVWGGCLLQKLKYVSFGGESVRRGALAAFVGQSAAGGSWFCCQGLRPLNNMESTRDQRRILSKV